MQASPNVDVSSCFASIAPSTDKAAPMPELMHTSADSAGGFDKIIQRRIIYYSDFELNINEWKTENEYIQLYATTLKKSLSNRSD